MTAQPFPKSVTLKVEASDVVISTAMRAAHLTVTIADLAKGLRHLKGVDDPFNGIASPATDLLDELLATLSGFEASSMDPGALLRAALCQEITRREAAERQAAELMRERDEAVKRYRAQAPGQRGEG